MVYQQRGAPALPEHDSFVIEDQHRDKCWDVMKKAFYGRYGQEVPIDTTDFVTRTDRILKGPAIAKQSERWKQTSDDI